MLFDLMVLARDTSFPDAQIRVICDTVTQENIDGNVELLRRMHASQDTSMVLASTPSPPQSVTSVQSKPYARPLLKTSSEPGAILCADNFYSLCNDERNKLKRLSVFCPFTLSFRRCPQSDRCQLIHICWEVYCKRGRTCMYSHGARPTCDSVFNGTRCSKTRRLVGDNKKKACARNHDYNIRLLMGAMRVAHELGFYGLSDARNQINTTPPTEPDMVADWMASDVESLVSEHDEVATVADVEECSVAAVEKRDLDDNGCAQSSEDESPPEIDLIMFS